MPTSSVPAITFDLARGFIAPDEDAILAGVQADTNAAFGGDMNPALETPQGQLATSETAIIGDKNAEFLALANNVDPAYASGRFQDAIARIYFLERTPAEPTAVVATCSGLAGVVIPAGALATSTDGTRYICTQAGVIGAGGTVDLQFASVITGPVPCPAHSLTGIYQAIPGWDSIDNAADGVLGNVVESRADFERRREQSVAKNSVGSLPSILGAVLAVDNVLDAKVVENDTAGAVTKFGVSLVKNSIYVSVSGGEAADVAQAIWSKKAPGCNYNGNTTVTVYDETPPYTAPFPAYDVKFEIPVALPFFFAVTLADSADVPSNAADLIKAAIVAAFSGADGGARARIASTVYASRFYAPVALLGSWVNIIEILIGTSDPATDTSVVVDLNKAPTIDPADITVTLL